MQNVRTLSKSEAQTVKDDNFHGKGKLTYKNGTIYEGEFKNDKFNGKGKLKCIIGNLGSPILFPMFKSIL